MTGEQQRETDEKVFKALADSSRRALLDALYVQNGQTLSELQTRLPMTRFGVMKHLQILEDAGLLTTRKAGREKYHYLNPVPIQVVYERWVNKYAQPWARALIGLKTTLEDTQTMTETQTHVMEIFIRTTPQRLWQALTDGEMTRQYYFASTVQSDWSNGAAYVYTNPAGGTLVDGEVLEADPPRRLVTTFRPVFAGEAGADYRSQVTYEIEQVGAACKLTLTHAGLLPEHPLNASMITGWAQILSGLKTLLETGEPLEMPA